MSAVMPLPAQPWLGAVSDELDAVMQSYGRCLTSPHFLDTALNRMAAGRVGSEGVYAALEESERRHLVRRTISSMILRARGSSSGAAMLDGIALQHSRSGTTPLDPELHAAWAFAVLASVAQYDPQWSGALEREWRRMVAGLMECFAAAW